MIKQDQEELTVAKFKHTFDFCFSVNSDEGDGMEISPHDLLAAIRARLDDIARNNVSEMSEACGLVDTIEWDEELDSRTNAP